MNKLQIIIENFYKENSNLSKQSINAKVYYFIKNNKEAQEYIEEHCKNFNIDLSYDEKYLYAKLDIKNPLICPECGKLIKISKKPKKYCSIECLNKNKSKIAKNWWFSLSDDKKNEYRNLYKEKFRQSNIKKYGIDTPYNSQIPEIIEKRKNNYKEKTGYNHWMKNPEVKEKLANTMIKKYGVRNSFQCPEIREKFENTMLEKYGNKNPYSVPEIYEKMVKSSKNSKFYQWDENNKILYQGYVNKLLDDLKNNNENFENIATEWNCPIFEYKINEKQHLYRPDLYLKNEKFIFEVKSIYTLFYDLENNFNKFISVVSDNFTLILTIYDKNKQYMFIFMPYINFNDFKIIKEKFSNYELMFFWQNDLFNKTELIKSMIKNKLNFKMNRLFARKLEVDFNPKYEDVKNFLNENHLQGFTKYQKSIALTLNNKIFAAMTFSKGRVMFKNNSDWEINRFAVLKDYSIPGAASRLLSNFIKKYNINKIISYSDILISNGSLYEKLGFQKINKIYKGYFYFKDCEVFNRFKFTKSNLVKKGFDENKTERQIMEELNYLRIETPGNIKYIKKI
jgi:hypothetical protein